MGKKLTSSKAKEILHDKSVHGHPLTDKQRRFFGAIAGGAKPYKAKSGGWLDKYDDGGKLQGPKVAPITLDGTQVFEHGEDNYTKEGLENGVGPTYLTPKGEKYAEAVGKEASKRGKKNIVSSGVQRAIETADIVANKSGASRQINPLLNTWNIGEFDGAPEGSFDEKFWVSRPNVAPKGGENFNSFVQRMEQAYQMIENAPKTDEMIAHSKVTRALKALDKTDGQWTPQTTKDFLKKPEKIAKKAQNGIEGTMGGLTDKGFNYNGAWGGPSMQDGGNLMPAMAGANQTVPMYQMGGSLPGAVGFTYARVAGAAPANGPYAKKTKASAQDGAMMRYYQHGLDFKPKTISQDGGIYEVLKQRFPSDATKVAGPVIPLTQKEKEEAARISAEGARKAAERDRKILEERKQKASTKGDINVPGSFNIAEKARLFPENVGGLGQLADEYLNPLYAIGSIADALGESVARRDPKAFAATAALTAGLGVLGFDPLGSAIKNRGAIKSVGNLFKSKEVPAAPSVPQPSPYVRLDAEGNAVQTAESLLSRFRNLENEPGLFEGLNLDDIETPSLRNVSDPLEEYYQRNPASDPTRRQTLGSQQSRSREDLQRRDIDNVWEREIAEFEAAEYEAAAAREEGITPLALPERNVQGPKFGDKNFKLNTPTNVGVSDFRDPETGMTFTQAVEEHGNNLLGKYTISDEHGYIGLRTTLPTGQEDPYLTVRDISFFNPNQKSAASQFNKVMSNLPSKVKMEEISTSMYSQPIMNQQVARWANNQPGRIELKGLRQGYLNPLDKAGVSPADQIIEQFPKIKKSYKNLSEALGQPLDEPTLEVFKRETGQHIPVTFERINTEAGKKWLNEHGTGAVRIGVPKYQLIKHWKNGGVAVDPNGYWNPENWGNPVIIPSTDITMEGVNQPLIGISDTGDVQYMQPGEDYSFDGNNVLEIPVAKKGVSVNMADQYPIEKLDQSLNFTNYNKPTKGGWLDKYK